MCDVVGHCARFDAHHVGDLCVGQIVEPTKAKGFSLPLRQLLNPLLQALSQGLGFDLLGW